MKRAISIFSILLVLVSLVGALMIPANAADWEYTFYATVGNTEYFIITSNAYDEILEAKIYNGVVPGMSLDVAGGATLGLVGVPTTDGEFKVFITLVTRDLGTVDIKVTVYINPNESANGTPVVTKDPTGETVVEGESATFIARADNAEWCVWEIAIADASITCEELPSYLGRGVQVTGYNTNTLVLSNIPKELNGAMVWCQFVGSDGSVTTKAATITVTLQKDATPVVTKDPTDETVEEGGEAVFVAKAKYAQSYLWQLVSPDGITYDCADAPKTFKGLEVFGADTERLVLKNIPLELNGYRILCKFTAGDVVSSKMAKLTVTEKAETEPATEATIEETTEETAEKLTEEPTEEQHRPQRETNSHRDNSGRLNQSQREETEGGDNTLLIVVIIAVAAVAIAAIAAFVVLKMRKPR